VQIDFDGKDNPAALGAPELLAATRCELKADLHCAGGFISPSGDGIKVFFRIPSNNDTHDRSFRALLEYFKNKYGLTADPSTGNSNRLCYMSSDQRAWFNANPTEFAALAPEKETKMHQSSPCVSSDLYSVEEVRRALAVIPKEPDYGDWMKIINATRSAVGEGFAIELLQEWSPEEDISKYTNKINAYQDVTAGTLFYLARKNGWLPEIYYDNKADRYYLRASTGEFRSYTSRHAQGFLRSYHIPDDKIDEMLQHLRARMFIDYALNVSGKPCGLHSVGGKRVLVPRGPSYIIPAAGEWPVTRAIIAGMLGGEKSDQYIWFICWLAFSLQSFYGHRWQQAQVLALIGEPVTGKSLLQYLITLYFGDSVVDVIQKMTGKTEFNGDWAEATHLRVDDEFSENTRTVRAQLQQTVKAVAVRETHRIHPKGKDAFEIAPFWRMTISCNPEPDSLAVLPLLDHSVQDKISLLWTSPFVMPLPASSAKEKEKLRAVLREEAPALIFDLLKLTDVPSHLRDPAGRFDLRAFVHPDAMAQIEELTIDGELLETVLACVAAAKGDSIVMECTAAEMMEKIEESDVSRRWSWLNEKKLCQRAIGTDPLASG
jgi:hypothetical protein